MKIKRKDFQKAASFLREFLLKLSDDTECAELRDSLSLVLLYMQKYYRTLQNQEKAGQPNLNLSRGLSPLTPFSDIPDKFQWRWVNLDSHHVPPFSLNDSTTALSLPPIIQASKQGDLKHLLHLIEKDKSCVEDRDALGRSALFYCVHFNQIDALRLLVRCNADVSALANDGSTCLHQACHDGSYIGVHSLLQFHADVNVQDNLGRYPVHWAVTLPTTDCLTLLIQYGVDVRVHDKDGMTPSMWACRLDHISHLELLSQADSLNVSASDDLERDNLGRTWVHWSIRRSLPLECLKTLLTEETANIKDDDGKTVLLLSAEQGSLESCKLIMKKSGDKCINDCDNHQRTALHLATIAGHGDCVNFLLEKRANLNAVDAYNATAWDYARNRQLHYCQLILMSHQRQRLGASLMTPHSLESSASNVDLDTEEANDMESKTSTVMSFSPFTPPTPPKRPRTNSTPTLISRRLSGPSMKTNIVLDSLTNNDDNFIRMDSSHANVLLMSEDSGLSKERYEEYEDVSERGMEVSDIDENDQITNYIDNGNTNSPCPRKQIFSLKDSLPDYPSQLVLSPSPPLIPQKEFPDRANRKPLALPETSQKQPPATPDSTSRQPHTSPQAPSRQPLTPLKRPTMNHKLSNVSASKSEGTATRKTKNIHVPSPPLQGHEKIKPGSASSQDQLSDTVSSVDTSQNTVISAPQHQTSHESNKNPPPMLTPLKNAPQPPVLDDNILIKTKRKKKKKGSIPLSSLQAESSSSVPVLTDLSPVVKPVTAFSSKSVTTKTHQSTKQNIEKSEKRSTGVIGTLDTLPPMVSGTTYPIRSMSTKHQRGQLNLDGHNDQIIADRHKDHVTENRYLEQDENKPGLGNLPENPNSISSENQLSSWSSHLSNQQNSRVMSNKPPLPKTVSGSTDIPLKSFNRRRRFRPATDLTYSW